MNSKRILGVVFLSGVLLLAACQKSVTTDSQPASHSSTSSAISQPSETSQSTETSQTQSSETTTTSSVEPVVSFPVGALIAAADKGEIERMKEILKDPNFNVNEQNSEGNSPLNIAVHKNDIEIAQLLIDFGADINLQNNISDSPYLYAGAEGRTKILRYMLMHAEPDLTKTNRYGGNTLIPAAEKGHLANVKLLVADGREPIDFQNNFGYTALIEAVALNDGSKLYQDIIQVLLEAGADKNLKDNSGQSTVDYAKKLGYTNMSQILAKF